MTVRNLWGAAAVACLGMIFSVGLAAAASSCGDGDITGGEECDPGGTLRCGGNPANEVCDNAGDCSGGLECFFEFSCCKHNCQVPGSGDLVDADCTDGEDFCTPEDICIETHPTTGEKGACIPDPAALADYGEPCGTPPAAECDAAAICDGAGLCLPPTVPTGASCTDDGNVCTDDVCDGGGSCSHPSNTAPCDDGLFCTGEDVCSDGICASSGSPCGDLTCSPVCNEGTMGCDSSEGLSCADDGKVCTEDLCDAFEVCQHIVLTGPCDDGSVCTTDDICVAEECIGSYGITGLACEWVALARADNDRAKLQTRASSQSLGDVCGDRLVIRSESVVNSDLVAMEPQGRKGIRVGSFCEVGQDIVTGGSGIKTMGSKTELPQLLEVDSLPAGSLTPKDDASGVYDLTGSHYRVGDCDQAQSDIVATGPAVAGLASDDNFGKVVRRKPGETLTVTAVEVGGVNVFDFDRLIMGKNAVIELDAGGDPNTVIILRVAGKYMTNINSNVVALGGLLPQNTMIYGAGKKCQIGKNNTGFGTVACVRGKVQLREGSVWQGQLLSGNKLLRVGEHAVLTYDPFVAF